MPTRKSPCCTSTEDRKLPLGIFHAIGIKIRAPALVAKSTTPMPRTAKLPARNNRQTPLRFGDWLLDPTSDTLQHRDGRTATLGTTAMTLLAEFAAHPFTPLSREQLSAVLGREYLACNRLIDVLVSQIRRTLGRQADGAAYIRTLRSVGYVFIAPVGRA